MRPVRVAPQDTAVRREGGAVYLTSPFPLGPYAVKLTERLESWAAAAPNRTFLAERDENGEWRRVSYGEALRSVRSLTDEDTELYSIPPALRRELAVEVERAS